MPLTRPLLLSPTTGVAVVQAVVLALAPHGGQHVARRNAWAGMAADAQRARANREAAAAVQAALEVAARRASGTGVALQG